MNTEGDPLGHIEWLLGHPLRNIVLIYNTASNYLSQSPCRFSHDHHPVHRLVHSPIIAINHTAGNGKLNRTAFSGKCYER